MNVMASTQEAESVGLLRVQSQPGLLRETLCHKGIRGMHFVSLKDGGFNLSELGSQGHIAVGGTDWQLSCD